MTMTKFRRHSPRLTTAGTKCQHHRTKLSEPA
jgi:hypothetical protein